MPLPKFVDSWSVPASGGAEEQVEFLQFSIELQEQSQWCWAAVTVSVAHYYDPKTSWTQCTLANVQLERNDCCAGGACNYPQALRTSLGHTGNVRWTLSQALPVTSLMEELQGGDPVACRIEWSGGGGHFLVIHGLTVDGASEPAVCVADPSDEGGSWVLYDVFLQSYLGSGAWTHSYALKPGENDAHPV